MQRQRESDRHLGFQVYPWAVEQDAFANGAVRCQRARCDLTQVGRAPRGASQHVRGRAQRHEPCAEIVAGRGHVRGGSQCLLGDRLDDRQHVLEAMCQFAVHQAHIVFGAAPFAKVTGHGAVADQRSRRVGDRKYGIEDRDQLAGAEMLEIQLDGHWSVA